MKRYLKTLACIVLGLLLLTQFNNCGNTEQPVTTYTTDGSSLSCVGTECIEPTVDWLKIKANLLGDYGVHAANAEFNLGGDCNEAAYVDNEVRWDLELGGSVVRSSVMNGLTTTGGPATSKCVNGRFMIYVKLSAIPSDNVNRTGLRTGVGTARATYSLNIKIIGKDASGAMHTNTVQGANRIFLIPL